MEVTRENFNDVLPKVEEAIRNATFLSIDCEFTGLNTVRDINPYDTQKQYYEKVRNTSRNFLVIQYGLTAFRYDAESDSLKQQTYNFYIFRRPVAKYLADQRFLCQTSSIDFLISNGFDFNKLFKNGIAYMNVTEETKYKETLEEQQKLRANNQSGNNGNKILIPKEDKPFIDNVVQQIQDFMADEQEELVLPSCNAFLRRLVYQTVEESYKDKVSVETRSLENKDRVLVVTRPKSREEKKKKEQIRVEEELKELDNTVGFAKVVRAIVSSGKLVVGHNMYLDMLHTIDKFLTPLPEEYDEFKECTHQLFSNILDTKYMCSTTPFRELIPSNILGPMINSIKKDPFTIPEIGIEEDAEGYTLNDAKEHEAGYDAFLTGVGFLTMWKYLGDLKSMQLSQIFKDYSLLKPYMNRLFMIKLQDLSYIHLGGTDPNPSRDHVFYMTFPKEWKTNDIVQLFSPFGNIHIGWINECSAYVGLQRREQAAVALSTLSQSDTYSVMTYARRQAVIEGRSSLPMSPAVKARRSLEGAAHPTSKRRKTNSFGENYSKRSIDPIEEDPEEESSAKEEDRVVKVSPKPIPISSGRKRKVSKTFEEDDSWE